MHICILPILDRGFEVLLTVKTCMRFTSFLPLPWKQIQAWCKMDIKETKSATMNIFLNIYILFK